ncbi:MAG: glucosaminidase domain-containing protein [Acidimicrobiia bacterium]
MTTLRAFLRRCVALFVSVGLVASAGLVLIATEAQPAGAAPTISIRGSLSLNVAQISAWFRAAHRVPYRASVPLEELVSYYLFEGAAANVRGDIAFVQSVLETGWFSFPAGGYVAPTDNNFAGMGAYGDGSHLFRAPSAQEGVRGQIQQLRRYADASSNQYNIGFPPIPELWNPPSRFDAANSTHGWAPNWNDLSGRWASSLAYADSIFSLYDSMSRFSGRSILDATTVPSGGLDGVTLTPAGYHATGWAIAPGTANPIDVDLYMNGTMLGRVNASGNRPDVQTAFPPYGPNHGYDVTFPATSDGMFCAYAIDPNRRVNPLLGCRSVSRLPTGSLDGVTLSPAGIRATGWAIAPLTQNPINVDLYLDGTMLSRVGAAGSRPDVGAAFPANGPNHGYDVTLPVVRGGRLCAYAIDPNLLGNPLLGCRMISTSPGGTLDGVTNSLSGTRVMGWAMSPVTAGSINVDFYVNGVMLTRVLASASRADIGAMFPANGSAHGYDLVLPATNGTLCVYAIDPTGGNNPSVGCRTIPAAAPTGSLDGATRDSSGIRFRGWAAAPGTKGPINVDLYLNGVMLGRVLATGSRPDVWSTYPLYGANHGYDVTIPGGSGTACAYGIDPTAKFANPLLGPSCVSV